MSDPSCDNANWTSIAKNTLFSKTWKSPTSAVGVSNYLTLYQQILKVFSTASKKRQTIIHLLETVLLYTKCRTKCPGKFNTHNLLLKSNEKMKTIAPLVYPWDTIFYTFLEKFKTCFFLKTPHYDDHQILNIQNDCARFFMKTHFSCFSRFFSLFTYAVLAKKIKLSKAW